MDVDQDIIYRSGVTRDAFALKYVLTVAASAIAEFGASVLIYVLLIQVSACSQNNVLVLLYTVTYPLDITRTRLQIQGEIHALGKSICRKTHRGMLQTMFGIGETCMLYDSRSKLP